MVASRLLSSVRSRGLNPESLTFRHRDPSAATCAAPNESRRSPAPTPFLKEKRLLVRFCRIVKDRDLNRVAPVAVRRRNHIPTPNLVNGLGEELGSHFRKGSQELSDRCVSACSVKPCNVSRSPRIRLGSDRIWLRRRGFLRRSGLPETRTGPEPTSPPAGP